MQQPFQNTLNTTAGPHHQQQQYGPPPNMGGYAPPAQQSDPPPDRAGPLPAPGMGPQAGPPGASSGQRESEMRQEEQRRKRFREFKEEKPVRPLSSSERGAPSADSFGLSVQTTYGSCQAGAEAARCCKQKLQGKCMVCPPLMGRQVGMHVRVLRGCGGCALCSLPAGVSQAAAAALLCAPA